MNHENLARLRRTVTDLTKPINNQVANALREALRAATAGSRWIQTINLSVNDAVKNYQFLASDEWMRPIAELVNDTLSNLRQLPIKIMRSGAPPNWHALTDDELETLLDIAEAGIPVAWVSRTDILRELAAARPDGRIAVLTKHETEIVDDCAAVVTEISAGEFAYFAAYLDEAIVVQRAGHPAAAQALAASVLDTLLRVAVHPPEKTGYYRKIKKKISEQVKWIPGAVAHLPILTALDTFFGEKDPIPTAFNRHATIHAVSPDQYTNGNALVSLMLAASILHEAHHVQPDVSGQHNDEPNED